MAEEGQEEGQPKEESKAEEKGNLAGERQSGDGQVRLTASLVNIDVTPLWNVHF